MTISTARRLWLACVLAATGCLDLNIPTAPSRGSATGVLDTTGHIPSAGNELKLVNTDTGGRLSTLTEGDGGFVFGDLAPGTYQLQADLPGFAPLREGPFRVRGGEPTALGTFTPTWLAQTPAEGTVSGVVIVNGGAGASDGGVVDGGSKPSDATGATVAFLLEAAGNTKVNEVTVNAFGAFTARLPPGKYTLRATHPYFVTAMMTGVVLAEGQQRDLTPQPLVMELNPAELVGTLRLEVDKDVMTRPGANVTITADTGVSAVSDAQGNFRLTGLAGGTRTITFRLPGFHDATAAHVLSFVAAETKTNPPLTLLLDRGDLIGTVEMADGTPIQQVTVDVPGIPYSAAVAPSTSMPSRGRFVISQVPIGTYNVRAARPNYAAAQSSAVTVAANAPVDVGTLRLTRIQGDFVIDDADATNTPGFVRQRDVTLVLSNVVNAAQYRVAEGSAASLMAATYQPFSTPRVSYQLTMGDGPKTVFLQIKDASNNESAPLESSVVLDTVAPASPTVAIANGQGFTRIANPIPVTLTADDPASGLAYVRLSASSMVDMNGELSSPRISYARDTSFTRPSSGDGTQDIYAQFIDNAGNVSAVAHATVVIDTVAPTGTITIARGARATVDGYTASVLVNLNVTPGGAEPNGGFLQVKLANDAALLSSAVLQPVTAQSAWFLDPLGEGVKTVHYVFVDAAGNQSGAGSTTIRYDVTPPMVTATLTSAARTNNRDATLTFTVTEANPLSPTEGLTLSENALFSGATPGPYPMNDTATFTVSASDGAKTINARVRDAAGNDGIATVSMELDRTAPSGLAISLTGALADGTTSTTLTSQTAVTVTLTHTGATGVSLGGSSVTTCPTSGYQAITGNSISGFALPGSGSPRVVTACFTDSAGNTAGPVSASIAIDTTTPTGCSLVLAGRRADGTASSIAKTALKDVTYTLSGCTEVPAEIFLTESTTTCAAAASINWDPYDSSLTNTVTVSALDGSKTVRGCVRDSARNTGSITAAVITLDTTPPSGTSVTLDSNAAYVNAAQKTARGNVNQVTVTGVAVGASDWAIAEGATPSTFVDIATQNPRTFVFGTGDGVKTIRALFRDDVGNTTSVEATDSIEFDTAPPTATSLSLAGTLADGTSSELVTTSTSVLATLVQAGATGVVFGDASMSTCPPTGYTSYSGGTVGTTLGGSGTTRTVRACLTDAAGNLAGPVSDTIDLDSAAPTGCTLVMSGKRADGSATALDKTAIRDVAFVLSGCAETPQEFFLVESTVTCTNSAQLDWKTYVVGSSTFSLSPVDGLKTVRGCVRDRARNVASLTSDDLTLDTTAPTSVSVLIDSGAAYVNSAQVTSRGGVIASVAATATGAFEWAIAESSVPSSYVAMATNPRNFTFTSGDGVKTIRALFRDDLGNTTSIEVTDSIEFDTVAPTVASLTLTGALATGTASTSITSTLAVQAAVVQTGATTFFVGDQAGSCPAAPYADSTGGSANYTLTGSGSTRGARACVADAAGNTAGPVTDTIDFDGASPTGCTAVLTGAKADGTPTSGGQADLTAQRDVTVVLTGCSETLTTSTQVFLTEGSVTCSTSSSLDWRSYSSGMTFTLTTLDGSKTVRGCVRDGALNVGSVGSDDITLDTTPPTGASVVLDTGAAYVNATQFAARGSANIASALGSATGAFDWALSESPSPSSFVAIATNPRNFTFSAGDGTKTIYAVFRDALGNATTAVTIKDDITFDTAAPSVTGATVTAVGPTANDYTSTETITVSVSNAPSDAVQAKVAQAASTADCVTSDLTLATAQSVVSSYLFTLTPAEGLKRVCVQWLDAAGNASTLAAASENYADTVTLDRTAPTTPQIITSDQAVSLADNAVFNVTISSASSDTNFSRYEKLGGASSTWTTVTPSGLSFAFNVRNPLPAAESGVRNELRLRAVDLAGNTSGESSVFVTADTNAPDALPNIIDEWMDNSNGKSTLYWQASATSTDLSGYRIFYGSTANNLTGSFATEGVSPIDTRAPNQTHFTLSGIPNGTKTFMAVAPVDLAGNVGPTSAVKALQPGIVSPNAVATINLSVAAGGAAFAERAVTMGRWLYVASVVGFCPSTLPSTCGTALHIVDTQNVETPIQRGTINPTPGIPAQVGSIIEFADQGVAHNGQKPFEMIIDGNLLFLVSGKFIHIMNLNIPSAPVSLADIDVSTINANYRLHSAALVGDKLVVSGRVGNANTTLIHGILNLAPLYVDGTGTRPTTADLALFTMAQSNVTTAFSTRDRYVQLINGGHQVVNLSDGLDPEPASGTAWTSADVATGGASVLTTWSPPVVSGNYAYGAASSTGFRVLNLASAWSGVTLPGSSVLASTAYNAGGAIDVRGAFAFLPDSDIDGLRVLSIGDIYDMQEVGVHSFGLSPNVARVFGHYAVVISAQGSPAVPALRFLELATPRALSVNSTANGAGGDLIVRPGFVFTSQQNVFDLHTPSAPVELSTTLDLDCTTHSAWFDEIEIGASGSDLVVRDLEKWTDRNSGTTPTTSPPDKYAVTLPAGTRVSGVAAWGNYLIAAEVRDTGAVGTDGIWLEIFNIRKVRDQVPSTVFTTADSVASMRVVATQTNLSGLELDVTMTEGRAALSIDNGVNNSTGTNLYIVDLRNAFDDNSGTSIGAASIQGSVPGIPRVRRTVIQGGFAYLATSGLTSPSTGGFWVFDLREALDDSSSTVLPANPPGTSLFNSIAFDSIVVTGSGVFLAPATSASGGVFSVDVSTPMTPQVQGFYALAPANTSCTPTGDSSRRKRNSIDVAGTRLYVTASTTLWVLNIE